MPGSVYIVKGEGVRDSVWTPKTGLSSHSIAKFPELLHTVPSPNCSVNPVVQVFAHPPTPANRLVESTPGLLAPNNAVTTPNVAPLKPSRLPTSRVSFSFPARHSNPQESQLRRKAPTFGSVSAASLAGAAMNPSSGPTSRQDYQHLAKKYQTAQAASSAQKPFPKYNRSPMVSAVLMKQATKSTGPKPHASSSQEAPKTLRKVQNDLLGSNAGREQQQQIPVSVAVTKNADESVLKITASSSSGIKAKSAAGRKDQTKPTSPPRKSLHLPEGMSLTDKARYNEKKKAMDNTIQRQTSHQQEKLTEKPSVRPLRPLSNLIEDVSIQKLSTLPREGTEASFVGKDVGKNAGMEPIPRENLDVKRISKPMPTQVAETRVDPQPEPGMSSKSTCAKNTPAERGSQPQFGNITPTSHFHVEKPMTVSPQAREATSIWPTEGPIASAKIAGSEGVKLSSATGNSPHTVVASARTTDDTEASRFTDAARMQGPAMASFTEKGALGNGVHSDEVFRETQREKQPEMRVSKVVEDQYSTIIQSLLTLAGRARQEGRSREGLSGMELNIYMKQSVLAALVARKGESPTELSRKAMELMKRLKISTSGLSEPGKPSRVESGVILRPGRCGDKSEVRDEDVRGLKNMLLCWERLRGNSEANFDEFHADVVHLKCVCEALQEGIRVSLSNEEVFQQFKELILVHTGIELVYDAIDGVKATYKSGNHESCKAWFRSTEFILKWYTFMSNRMELLLTAKNEVFARALKEFCKEFTRGLTDGEKRKDKLGDGVKIGGKLRTLKKLIKSLWEDDKGRALQITDKDCLTATEKLTSVVKLFIKLLKTMAQHGLPERSTEVKNVDGAGGSSSREGSPEADRVTGIRKNGTAVSRKYESSAKHGERNGPTNKVIGTNRVSIDPVFKQGSKAGVPGKARSSPEDIAKRDGISERKKQQERGNGNVMSSMNRMKAPLSIPRRPLPAESVGKGNATHASRSSGSSMGGGRAAGRMGPAATVQDMLAKAVSPAAEKSRKRKRGESILQNHEEEELDQSGMRSKRMRRSRIRFRVEPVVLCGPPKNFATLSTLFNDGENWLTNDNEVQKAAISDRNAKLSRGTVSTLFGFLRAFIWQQKCTMMGVPFATPRFLPTPFTPSALRELSRRIPAAPPPATPPRKQQP